MKSVYELLRRMRQKRSWADPIWIKGLPLKILFFLWRAWMRRIPTGDNLQRIKIYMVFRCHCCERKEVKTMTHLFLTVPIILRLWKQFATCAGIQIEGMQLQQLIHVWWNFHEPSRLRKVMQAMSAIIMWSLWK